MNQTALEGENDELEAGMEASMAAWQKRLQDIDSGAQPGTPIAT